MSVYDEWKYKTPYHDFDIFEGCFPRKIMPSDIDGIVECNGNFLVMEFKPEDKVVSKGQWLTLTRLSFINKFTVVIIYHKPRKRFEIPQVTSIQVLPYGGRKSITLEELRAFVKQWCISTNTHR